MKRWLVVLWCKLLQHNVAHRLVMPVEGPPSVWLSWCQRCGEVLKR